MGPPPRDVERPTFAGAGAKNRAIVASPIENSKLAGIDPYSCRADVLSRFVDLSTPSRRAFPWNRALAQVHLQRASRFATASTGANAVVHWDGSALYDGPSRWAAPGPECAFRLERMTTYDCRKSVWPRGIVHVGAHIGDEMLAKLPSRQLDGLLSAGEIRPRDMNGLVFEIRGAELMERAFTPERVICLIPSKRDDDRELASRDSLTRSHHD